MRGESEHVRQVLAEILESEADTAEAKAKADAGQEQAFPTEAYVDLLKKRGI